MDKNGNERDADTLLPEGLLETLSVKGRLYVEAALEIAQGDALVKRGAELRDRGLAALDHLDGKSGERGKRSTAGGRRVDESSLVARASKAPAKKTLAKKTIAARGAREGAKKPSAKTVRDRDAEPADPEQDAADAKKILELRCDEPLTRAKLMVKLGRSYYPLARVLRSLEKDGKIVCEQRACRLA